MVFIFNEYERVRIKKVYIRISEYENAGGLF
jgi:hypothetical protein